MDHVVAGLLHKLIAAVGTKLLDHGVQLEAEISDTVALFEKFNRNEFSGNFAHEAVPLLMMTARHIFDRAFVKDRLFAWLLMELTDDTDRLLGAQNTHALQVVSVGAFPLSVLNLINRDHWRVSFFNYIPKLLQLLEVERIHQLPVSNKFGCEVRIFFGDRCEHVAQLFVCSRGRKGLGLEMHRLWIFT